MIRKIEIDKDKKRIDSGVVFGQTEAKIVPGLWSVLRLYYKREQKRTGQQN